jgi:hypothetical protein
MLGFSVPRVIFLNYLHLTAYLTNYLHYWSVQPLSVTGRERKPISDGSCDRESVPPAAVHHVPRLFDLHGLINLPSASASPSSFSSPMSFTPPPNRSRPSATRGRGSAFATRLHHHLPLPPPTRRPLPPPSTVPLAPPPASSPPQPALVDN